jgi:hypothetical protein
MLVMNPRSTPTSGVGAEQLASCVSGNEPSPHPGERGGGGANLAVTGEAGEARRLESDPASV